MNSARSEERDRERENKPARDDFLLIFCGEGKSLLGDVRLVMQDEQKDGKRSLCVRKRNEQ